MKTSALSAAVMLALTVSAQARAEQETPDCVMPNPASRAECMAARKAACTKDGSASECQAPGVAVEPEAIERITVVGTRFGMDVGKYPGSASVLLADDLNASSDVLQSLQNVPGVDIGNDYGRAIGQGFTIRGFGHGSESRVILMQDGVRRSANLFANQVSGLGMDSDLLKQVDVVRGSSGISYGGGAIGGVIGSTTKDANDFILPGRDLGLVASYRFDSNNQHQLYGAFAYAPRQVPLEFLTYVKTASRGDMRMAGKVAKDGIRQHYVAQNQEDIDSRFFKAAWNISEGHRLALSHFDYRLDVETGWNSLYHAEPNPRYGPVVGERIQQDTVLNYKLSLPGKQWLNLSANAYKTTGTYERGYAHGIDLYYKNKDERRGLSVQNLMTFSTGNIGHRLLVGMDYENREEDALYFLDGVRTYFGSMPSRYRDTGIFIQHESNWMDNRLTLQLGGRHDSFDREVRNVEADYKSSRFSPRAGLSYQLFDGFNLLANYSRAFRAPTPHETSSKGPLNIHYWYVPNPDLKAETSAEHEVGFSWRKHGLFRQDDRFNTKLMYFSGHIENMIRLVVDHGSVSPGDSEYAQYRNVAGVDRKGLEFEAAYDQVHWGMFMTFAKLDMTDTASKQKSPAAFADVARFGFNWRPVDDDLQISLKYSHWFKPDQNPESLISGGVRYWYVREAFNQTDLQVRWRPWNSGVLLWDDSMTLLFGINNMFNQRRLNAASVETSSRSGLGRNVYFSLTKQF